LLVGSALGIECKDIKGKKLRDEEGTERNKTKRE
jgi:hypothetical protein